MKPSIELKHLERLRDDYQAQARTIPKRQVRTDFERRLLEMHSRVLGSCAQDLDDLIKGRDHPSGRRG